MGAETPEKAKENQGDAPDFDLKTFFPYLVRFFYTDVTSAMAESYQSEFDMTPAEWRAIVILGPEDSLTANEIVRRSSMDKVAISRAIAKMKRNKWIDVYTNINDGRSKLLSLSEEGKTIYNTLVPKVLDVEKKLLNGITDQQKKQFIRTMERIRENRARLLG